jgi:hypothetical protein
LCWILSKSPSTFFSKSPSSDDPLPFDDQLQPAVTSQHEHWIWIHICDTQLITRLLLLLSTLFAIIENGVFVTSLYVSATTAAYVICIERV